MKQVEVKLFDGFLFFVDGEDISLSEQERETFALLFAAGGNPVTAKQLWKLLYEPKGCRYSSHYYAYRVSRLRRELFARQLGDILENGLSPVRFTRIDRALTCDYFAMLDGKLPLLKKELFLPEYSWSAVLYSTDWERLQENWERCR